MEIQLGKIDRTLGCIANRIPAITLRDFFAGCALMGFLTRGECDDALEAIPHDAYLYADAMLEARGGSNDAD
jgi:hypothetical protein